MRLVTSGEMKQIDSQAMEDYGMPGIVLMENAGRQVAGVATEIIGQETLKGKKITVFVGKGNNGGDGLVAARHLINQGAEVKVLLLNAPDEITGDARVNLDIWNQLGQKAFSVHQVNGINIAKVILLNTDLIIDAIFGTGFHGPVNEKLSRIIDLINESGIPIVAVDIPSGMEADTGDIPGSCIKATRTVTFGLPKLGLVLEPGLHHVGVMDVVDISLPRALIDNQVINRHWLTSELVTGWLPRRSLAGHKGDYGRLLLVAGARGMTGAAVMATRAALRSGAGVVTLGVPASEQPAVAAQLTEAMSLSLPGTANGTLAAGAAEVILSKTAGCDALALGPGLSRDPETVDMVRSLIKKIKVPLVLDADGLNALAGAAEILQEAAVPVVCTPHPGEMARLMEISIEEVQANRLPVALAAARKLGAVMLLKGYRTIVATPEGAAYINSTGNPGMATGGSGDVLTGIIAALIGQGLPADRAAAAGAFIHGLAGDLAAVDFGQVGLIAGDILAAIPRAIKKLIP